MFSRLFRRGPKQNGERREPTFTSAPRMPILVRQSVFEDSNDGAIVEALIDEYVNPLTQRGYYFQSELPANAMRCYHTDYYLAQVANGGHGQFMHNSGMSPITLRNIRGGLAAIGFAPHISVFKDFETKVAADAKWAASVAESGGFGEPDPIESELNGRFYANDGCKALRAANGRWLKTLPEVQPVPDAEFPTRIAELIVSNPQATARKLMRERERLAAQLQDPLHVAARLLAFEKGLLPVQIGGGDPSAVTPDGHAETGWAVLSQQARFTMFLTNDAALLCEQFLADGRKLTPELMDEIRLALNAPEPNLDNLRGFEQMAWKEIARIPAALVQEAMAVARNGDILAAAEIACMRLNDDLVDLHALSKTRTTPTVETWAFAIWGQRENYMMLIRDDGMLVDKLGGGPARPGGMMFVALDDVRRHKAASAGGIA